MMEKNKNPTLEVLKFNIGVALMLAALKLVTGFLTHSMAILASALDSAMDVATSTVNLIAAREAAKPPDEDHAYGHGKIESLASLFQSVFIGLSGAYLIFESAKRLAVGSFVNVVPVGIGVMGFSIVMSALIVWRMQRAAQKSRSLILATERLHFATDIWSNGGVIAALGLVALTHFVFWDLAVSIGVSFYIFKTSYGILRHSIDELLDRSLPPVSKDEIESMIRNFHPSVVGVHNLRSRRVGEQIFLDFHIEIRGEDDFKRAHLLTESLIQRIRDRYPEADVTVHFDPEGEM